MAFFQLGKEVNMKNTIKVLALLVAFSALPAVAKAVPVTLGATLSGANEVPPTPSLGTGFTTVTIDTATHLLTVNITFSGLTGLTTASHIHCCGPVGTNQMVATQTPTFVGFPLNVTAGTYSNTFNLTLASSYNPAFITAHGGTVAQAEADFTAGLLTGQTYLNIHTNIFPGGEIRGQLTTPEPVTVVLLGTGLAGVAGVVRRRRKTQV
jgi:hypothetical protein